jgi:hypothetical protein
MEEIEVLKVELETHKKKGCYGICFIRHSALDAESIFVFNDGRDSMDSRLRGTTEEGFRTSRNDRLQKMKQPHKIPSGASGPGIGQCTLIKRTMNMKQHNQRHDMSLPIAPFPKGQGGRSGGGGGLIRDLEVKKMKSKPRGRTHKLSKHRGFPLLTKSFTINYSKYCNA